MKHLRSPREGRGCAPKGQVSAHTPLSQEVGKNLRTAAALPEPSSASHSGRSSKPPPARTQCQTTATTEKTPADALASIWGKTGRSSRTNHSAWICVCFHLWEWGCVSLRLGLNSFKTCIACKIRIRSGFQITTGPRGIWIKTSCYPLPLKMI